MAPKKVEAPERKPLIGRVGTNLKVGIVGIPNVGKSTFFNVLTKSQAAAENFPFCTIDPNENKYITLFVISCDMHCPNWVMFGMILYVINLRKFPKRLRLYNRVRMKLTVGIQKFKD